MEIAAFVMCTAVLMGVLQRPQGGAVSVHYRRRHDAVLTVARRQQERRGGV